MSLSASPGDQFHTEAQASYEKLIAEFPASPLVAEARYAKGHLLRVAGQIEAAEREFEIVLAEYPESDRVAEAAGLVRTEIEGRGFGHAVYLPRAASPPIGPLHVYLTGDGTPYIRRTLPAADPTPRRPIVLDLMAVDPAPRLLLGRPCYHGLARRSGCSNDLWTQARFGAQVVESMEAALKRLVTDGRPVLLIGFSGGGALAVLLARRLPDVIGVVTLGGTLDRDAWTRLHGYSPLARSENPVAGAKLPPRVRQLHLAGGRDRVAPPGLIRPAAARLGGRARVLPDTSHRRGWARHWPRILVETGRWGSGPAPR
jgi:pimeloyl-ACP methyl ester carboxylesterase